jgi:hypothetical protein
MVRDGLEGLRTGQVSARTWPWRFEYSGAQGRTFTFKQLNSKHDLPEDGLRTCDVLCLGFQIPGKGWRCFLGWVLKTQPEATVVKILGRLPAKKETSETQPTSALQVALTYEREQAALRNPKHETKDKPAEEPQRKG